MKVIHLTRSYRCPPAVIELANRLANENPVRIPHPEPLSAARPGFPGEGLRLEAFKTLAEELDWLIGDIRARPEEEWGQCVVLARTRKLLEEAARTLRKAGLKTVLAAPKREFESAPLRWLHALLRLASSPSEPEQLARLSRAFYELEGLQLQIAPRAGADLLAAWFDAALSRRELEPYTRGFLSRAREYLDTPLGFLILAREAFDWFEEVDRRLSGLPQEEFVDFREERRTFEELEKEARDRFGEDLTLPILLQELDLSPKLPPLPADAVKCLTIHTAKGLEFDTVYLIGLVEGFLPSYLSTKEGASGRALEEERRACVVAITRARQSLSLSYAKKYFGWLKRPSRFLSEMGLLG